MKRILHIAILAFILATPAFGVEISPILEGKMAAFSFTYDDGAYSHYTTALPMHMKYGMPATFFIITDRVEQDGEGRAKKYCSWSEVCEMAAKGMEMASHTKTHRNMRELESAGLTREQIARLSSRTRARRSAPSPLLGTRSPTGRDASSARRVSTRAGTSASRRDAATARRATGSSSTRRLWSPTASAAR